jgi:hypothetical protein
MIHENLKDAFQAAYISAPCGIAYIQRKGWAAYDLRRGIKNGIPEFFIFAKGRAPICLNDTAQDAWASLLKSEGAPC